jgi:cyclase
MTITSPEVGMYRTLIVARMLPDAKEQIAGVFAASDRTELPALVGVRSRSLFQFGDVYMHLVEGDRPMGPAVAAVHDHPQFVSISEELKPFVSAYHPDTWRSPADAMAQEFYRWERDG